MLEDRTWLTRPLGKASVKDLCDIHRALQIAGYLADWGGATGIRKANLIIDIEQARQTYWNSQHATTIGPRHLAGASVRPGWDGITATEVNAWLRTLPPVPLHGEVPHA